MNLIRNTFILFWLCSGMASLFITSSCNTEKRAAKKIAIIDAKHPLVTAKFCGSRFPVSTYDSIKEIFKEGKTVFINTNTIDTIYDTITNIKYLTHTKYALRVDTFYKTTTKQIESTAKLDACKMESDKVNAKYVILHERYKAMSKWFFFSILGILIMIAWKVANWMRWIPF